MKILFYKICRYLGLFWVAKLFFRNKLLILCYHGVSVRDEHQWWPGVFMSEVRFHRRMQLLKQHGYQVLGLSEALSLLKSGDLPPSSIVITADDGYLNSPQTLCKHCAEFNFPLTIYVTSYYVQRRNPIFKLMVQYLFWRTDKRYLVGDLSFAGITETKEIDLSNDDGKKWLNSIIDYGQNCSTEEERQNILIRLCELMDFDYEAMKNEGMFMLMDEHDLRRISDNDVDIQLHTHRHCFPLTREDAMQEINDNRAVLEPIINKSLTHFCYPSGVWDKSHHPFLKEQNIESATTCRLGFVTKESDFLALNRYLDKDDISENEFLAEISGFLTFTRKIRDVFK